MIGPQLGEKFKGNSRESSPELLTRDESLRKDAPIRDWDKDKKNGRLSNSCDAPSLVIFRIAT